jgi:hypothetical protein
MEAHERALVIGFPSLSACCALRHFPKLCVLTNFDRTKAIIYTLVRSFRFNLGVDPADILKKAEPEIYRPYLASKPKEASQLPLSISAV